ncbi:cytochrome P450 [Phellopilus nigrolimitatus]|nr:cytochrome P450 [Phellopilus nigrolimitatus]
MDNPLLRRVWSTPQSPLEFFYLLFLPIVGIYCATVALRRLFISPLRGVPGPWYAAISDLWLTSHILRLRRCYALDDLFRKYGPIVRIAPNKILFVDVQTLKNVYGVSGRLSKSSWYKSFMTYENDHAMTTLDHGPHQARKKGTGPHYTPTNLALFQPEIHDYVNEMVNILKVVASESLIAVDSLLLFHHLMIDINCMHLFFYDCDSLTAWKQHNIGLTSAPPDRLSMAIGDFPKRGVLKVSRREDKHH